MIVGHPFKGGLPMSTGYLSHPDMKRFGLDDSTVFVPPRPNAFMNALSMGMPAMAATQVPSFGDFFGSYFGGRPMNITNPKCTSMLEGMKKCYENHAKADPINTC